MNMLYILGAKRTTKVFQQKNEMIVSVLGRLLWHVRIDRRERILKIETRKGIAVIHIKRNLNLFKETVKHTET